MLRRAHIAFWVALLVSPVFGISGGGKAKIEELRGKTKDFSYSAIQTAEAPLESATPSRVLGGKIEGRKNPPEIFAAIDTEDLNEVHAILSEDPKEVLVTRKGITALEYARKKVSESTKSNAVYQLLLAAARKPGVGFSMNFIEAKLSQELYSDILSDFSRRQDVKKFKDYFRNPTTSDLLKMAVAIAKPGTVSRKAAEEKLALFLKHPEMDVSKQSSPYEAESDDTYSGSSFAFSSPGGSVTVRSYQKKDGTFVRSHTRTPPRGSGRRYR